MGKRIVIVDYGVSNLYSVKRAVEVCGGEDVHISNRAEDLAKADKIILPGVGAFKDGMNGLHKCSLIDPLVAAARSGKHILGICLGMQLLATSSEEFGISEGLSLIPGEVKSITRSSVNGKPIKIPSIGWFPLMLGEAQVVNKSCLFALHGKAVYMTHSFQFLPSNPDHLLASYDLGGHLITAAVRQGNITGVQFHPEKSGPIGLIIIKRFLEVNL
jgi:glutamine amidotransferase